MLVVILIFLETRTLKEISYIQFFFPWGFFSIVLEFNRKLISSKQRKSELFFTPPANISLSRTWRSRKVEMLAAIILAAPAFPTHARICFYLGLIIKRIAAGGDCGRPRPASGQLLFRELLTDTARALVNNWVRAHHFSGFAQRKV